MRAVIQRVKWANLSVNGKIVSEIANGLLVFIGIENVDNKEDIEWLGKKIIGLRIFDDDKKIPNLSVKEVEANIMLVSQFTLFASTKKGNRPSYIRASKAEHAIPIYESMIDFLNLELGRPISTGIFGADMQIELLNDGPITIVIDSKSKE